MPHHCKFCGEELTAEEAERSEKHGTYVCHDCLHHGLTLLQKALGEHVLGKMAERKRDDED